MMEEGLFVRDLVEVTASEITRWSASTRQQRFQNFFRSLCLQMWTSCAPGSLLIV